MSKDKASFLVQILKIQMVNGSISMFFMSSIPQKGMYQDYEFTFQWWIVRWRLLEQCFTQENLILYTCSMHIHMERAKTTFDFNHLDKNIDKNQLDEIKALD